jgi:hypothetical protein
MAILDNWMSTVDSPTYNFALYAVTAAVSDDPLQWLSQDAGALSSGKAILIAKSGVTTSYLIDNVVLHSTLVSNDAATAVQTSVIDFDLSEPLGFELADRLMRYSNALNASAIQNILFVLRLEFKGLKSGSSIPVNYPGKFFYPFRLTALNATVGPEGARYHMTGNLNNRIAVERAITSTDISFSARTVGNFLSNLELALNQHETNIRVTDTSQTAIPQKIHRIVIDRSMAGLIPTNMRGISDLNSDGTATSSTTNLEKAFTIGPNSNIANFIKETLTKESVGYQLLYDANRADGTVDLPYIRVNLDMEYQDDRTDPTTNQRREIIIYNVVLFQSFERIDNDIPAVETAFRQDVIRQNRLVSNMSQFTNKRYDYLFTGLNTEILNVDLSYDFNYFNALSPSRGVGYTDANQDFQPQTTSTENPFAALAGFLENSILKPLVGTIAPVYDYQGVSSTAQRVTETTGTTDAVRMQDESENQSLLNSTFMQFDMTIKGDPFWMGLPGVDDGGQPLVTNSVASATQDSLIVFLNYLPHESLVAPIGQHRGRLDIATSGIYRVWKIVSRFQNGKFTQVLSSNKETQLTTEVVKNRLMGFR